jgi:hypothetical protein
MEASQFDALTRALVGTTPRRSLLIAAGGAFAALAARFSPDVAAGCAKVGQKCGKGKHCCGGARCRHGRCRCPNGWLVCGEDGLCRDLATDPNNCGGCGQTCATGCCAAGACRPTCGGGCCADCFVEQQGTNILKGTEACCADSSVCRSAMGNPADDRCCWPDEACIDGKCCCNGCEGTVVCGDTCCPSVSCCHGKCCGEGQVCARPKANKPPKCVSADRSCASIGDCFAGEECRGGTCCSGDRVCLSVGPPFNPKCCAVGEYCDPLLQTCCPIGIFCQTAKKVRIPAH